MLYFYFNLILKNISLLSHILLLFYKYFQLQFLSCSFFCIIIFHLNLHEHYEVMEATDTLLANNLIHIFKEGTSENVTFLSFYQFFYKCDSTEFSPK